MKAAYVTLGCKVSQYETQSIRTLMESRGYETVPFTDIADVYIINSCTVTATGDKKSRQMTHRARRLNPEAVVVLCGCFPQASPDVAVKENAADIICGTVDRMKIPDLVEEFIKNGDRIVALKGNIRTEAYEPLCVDRLDEHTRAYIKIEDGCDRFCTYCLVPFARGNIRSRKIDHIREEASRLKKNGYREIVLTGINLSAYSSDGKDLADAVKAAAESGISRVRLGSLEPELLTEDMISRLSEIPQLCRQFHISLQSGSDGVLKRMGRRYTAAEYAEIASHLRAAMPDCALTTDIMVGFPGETEEEFRETLNFVDEIGFASAHIFIYSRRRGTVAAEMSGQISAETGKQRSKALVAAVKERAKKRLESLIGSEMEALALEFDGVNTLCIARDGTEMLLKGEHAGVFSVILTGITGEKMIAEIKGE